MSVLTRPKSAPREPFVPDPELGGLREQRQHAAAAYKDALRRVQDLTAQLGALEARVPTLEPEDLLARETRRRDLSSQLEAAHERLTVLAVQASDPARIAAHEQERAARARAQELYAQAGSIARRLNSAMASHPNTPVVVDGPGAPAVLERSAERRQAHDERLDQLMDDYNRALTAAKEAADRAMRPVQTELDARIRAEAARAANYYRPRLAEETGELLRLLGLVRDQWLAINRLNVEAAATRRALDGAEGFGFTPLAPGFFFHLTGNQNNAPPIRRWVQTMREHGFSIPKGAFDV